MIEKLIADIGMRIIDRLSNREVIDYRRLSPASKRVLQDAAAEVANYHLDLVAGRAITPGRKRSIETIKSNVEAAIKPGLWNSLLSEGRALLASLSSEDDGSKEPDATGESAAE